MKITHPELLSYINQMPELSGFHIIKIINKSCFPEWKKHWLCLCHTSFFGASLTLLSCENGESEEDLVKALHSLQFMQSEEEDFLMLNGDSGESLPSMS